MRRSDRQITDKKFISDIFSRAHIMRVGFVDNDQVYIVPVNYGYCEDDGKITLYFHGAKAGRKYELALTRPQVGFELDVDYALDEGEIACEYSANYASIIGNGSLSIVSDSEDAIRGLEAIMDTNAGAFAWEFDPKVVAHTAVFRLDVETFTCKARRA